MNEKKEPNLGGRPTKWSPAVNEELLAFFDIEPYREVERVNPKTGGTIIEIVPNKLPFFSAFARKIGVNTDTLNEWGKQENLAKYPGFSESYKQAKEMQKEMLIHNGLAGNYNATAFIFTAKNITDMRDVNVNELTGKDGAALFPEMSKEQAEKILKRHGK